MQEKIDRALQILGIKNFLLGIHDAAFPSLSGEDFGRGTPYSEGAAEFLGFAGSLGFTGVQLGPQGITTTANASPYDGSFFSRNPLSLAPFALNRLDCPLLDQGKPAWLTAERAADSTRVNDAFARRAVGGVIAEVCSRYRRDIRQGKSAACTALGQSFALYRRQNADWLERDALYQVLRQHYGDRNWKLWSGGHARLDSHLPAPPAGEEKQARRRIEELHRQYSEAIEDYCFTQFLLAEQHRGLRAECRKLGLKIFGDCQIGFSGRDAWAAQSFLLPDYVMGAPPSRTNPEGQPWNYPVLDPRHYGSGSEEDGGQPGAAVTFLRQRIRKLVDEYDGLRLDHPHGLICPWVYKVGLDDPFAAVRNGARLFASPMISDHPLLNRYAIVRPEQLNRDKPRHDDNWVADLDEKQVRRYARLFDVVLHAARQKWSGLDTIACEILSTQPYPIKRVMDLYGLGRFRVTQKVDLENRLDVYRSENASPEDWLMLGNHDTASIWQVAERWIEEGVAGRQGEYLAGRLRIPEEQRTSWIERLSTDAGALVQARFADLFVGPARNIMVYFTDLLGMREAYNKPGTVSAENWSLRIPPDYKMSYGKKVADNLALNIPKALAAALRSRGETFNAENSGLR